MSSTSHKDAGRAGGQGRASQRVSHQWLNEGLARIGVPPARRPLPLAPSGLDFHIRESIVRCRARVT